jgi:hypothetical protein
LNVWKRGLLPDSHYSLQLTDNRNSLGNNSSDPPKVPFSVSFKTSRFASLVAHVEHAQSLFGDVVQIPVLDNATAPETLRNIIGAAIDVDGSGHDEAVEAVYRRLLGINSGRLASVYSTAGQEIAASFVGRNRNQLAVWGLALELTEPILGKPGASVLHVTNTTDFSFQRGILLTQLTGENRLVLRDSSGARVLIFNSSDGHIFNPITTATQVDFQFALEDALRAVIADYVNLTFSYETPSIRATKVTETLDAMKTIPEINAVIAPVVRSFIVPVV